MSEGSTITLAIPPEALERLKEAEARQRAETKRRGLPAEPVSVEGKLLLQTRKGVILCGCDCGLPLDFNAEWSPKDTPPGFPVIAHRLSRGSRGGHVVGNVFIDRHACNKRDAGPDTTGAASVKRHTPDFTKRLLERESRDPNAWQKPAGKIKGRGFDKTRSKGFDGKVRERG